MTPIEIDTRGLRCPLPVIRLAAAARNQPPGTVFTLLASDRAARYDVPAWCRMRNHELREVSEVPDGSATSSAPASGDDPAYLRFVVVLGPQRPKAGDAGNGSAPPSRAT